MEDSGKKLLISIVKVQNLTNVQTKHSKDYMTLDIYGNGEYISGYPQNLCSSEREAARVTFDQRLRAS